MTTDDDIFLTEGTSTPQDRKNVVSEKKATNRKILSIKMTSFSSNFVLKKETSKALRLNFISIPLYLSWSCKMLSTIDIKSLIKQKHERSKQKPKHIKIKIKFTCFNLRDFFLFQIYDK